MAAPSLDRGPVTLETIESLRGYFLHLIEMPDKVEVTRCYHARAKYRSPLIMYSTVMALA